MTDESKLNMLRLFGYYLEGLSLTTAEEEKKQNDSHSSHFLVIVYDI